MHPRVHARREPERVAIVSGDGRERQTYGQLVAGANRLSRCLRALGLRSGDHVAVLLDNHPRYFEPIWSALNSGLFVTPLSTLLTPREAARILDDSGAQVLVTARPFAPAVSEIRALTSGVTHVLMLGGTVGGVLAYEDLVDGLDPSDLVDETPGALMLYSSGTTGAPKGIKPRLREGGVEDPQPLSETLARYFSLDDGSVYLSTGPLYHAAPLKWNLAVQAAGGVSIVLPSFDAEGALAAMAREGVTHSQWVPTMFNRLLDLDQDVRERYDLSRHRIAVHAAAPCPVEVKRRMMAWWGPILTEYYAGTESNGLCVISAKEWLSRPGSVGRSVRGTVHIMDETGEAEQPTGLKGLIYFEGGTPFEYHGDPDKTAAARNGRGWTTIGDIGFLDDEGYLFLSDRRDDLIISGGVNIYPREIEMLLSSHDDVRDAAVVGAPDGEYGQAVRAVVETISPSTDRVRLERELRAMCAADLARYKHPRSYEFVDRLPRLPTGKLLRRVLREREEARAGAEISPLETSKA